MLFKQSGERVWNPYQSTPCVWFNKKAKQKNENALEQDLADDCAQEVRSNNTTES